ncbi:MAG UNVERIFIED_CONTAM: hypothetical protein LVQ98_00635 [Rickettsiaceae bacterium]|jgi:uncharacterized FlgJ-related protein
MKLKIFLIALFFTLTSAKIYAEAPKSDSSNLEVTKSGKNTKAADDAEKYKKVMDEYKAFLSKTTPAIRDEIREYRKEVVRINKRKNCTL